MISWLVIAYSVKSTSKHSKTIHFSLTPVYPTGFIFSLLPNSANISTKLNSLFYRNLLFTTFGTLAVLFPLPEMVFLPSPLFYPLPCLCSSYDVTFVWNLIKAEVLVSFLYPSSIISLFTCLLLLAVIWLRVRTLFIYCRVSPKFIFSPECTTDFHNHVSSCFWTMSPSILKIIMSNTKLNCISKCSFYPLCFSYYHLLSDFPGWEPRIQPSPHRLCPPLASVTESY